jgi:DNA end-binding protein Ku
LRYPYEVRQQDEYFEEIEDEKVPKDMLDLATHIVDTKRGKFQPEKFQDEYEDALKELLRKKQRGEKIEQPKERAPSNVINLMDALRNSLKAEGGPPPARPAKKARKKIEGQREMLLPISGKKAREAPVKRATRPHARRRSAG